MGLFRGKRTAAILPPDIVDRVIAYIRTETDSPNAPANFDTRGRIYSLHSTATADPAAFTEALAAAVIPAGGEAARGGARLVWELIGSDFDDPNHWAMLDTALDWLHESGISAVHLFGYETSRWTTRGTTW